jgi:hypothetical protein
MSHVARSRLSMPLGDSLNIMPVVTLTHQGSCSPGLQVSFFAEAYLQELTEPRSDASEQETVAFF